MPKHPHPAVRTLTLLFVCQWFVLSPGAQALVGESAERLAGEYYENALKRFAEDDFDGTIIQLKNALQQNAKMLPAMVLLGRAQLELGHGEAAQTFLDEARQAGADDSLTAVPMARALLLQFKHDEVLKQAEPPKLPPMVRAELHVVKARAALETNDRKALDASLRVVEGIDPQSGDLLAIKTLLAMQDGDMDGADKLIRNAEERYPDMPSTWLSRASWLHLRGQVDEALAAYGKVIELDPKSSDARLARIGLLFDLQREAETDEDFEKLDDLRPDDPRVTYLTAVKLERAGDKEGARQALSRANAVLGALGPGVVNRNAQLLLVAGISSYSLGNLEGARTALTQYVQMAPTDFGPRKVLASVLIQQRDYRDAIKVLEDTVDHFNEDAEVLVMLGQAYEGAGKNQKAQAVLKRATELRGEDTMVATRLALNKVRTGEMRQALSDLSSIFTRDKFSPTAGMPLAVLYLQQDNYERAAEIARKLLERDDDNLEFHNILGIAEVGRGNFAAARTAFERIAKVAPDNEKVQINLAKLDVRERKFDEARHRIKDLLAQDPNSALLTLELARVAAAAGDTDEALRGGIEANRLAPDSFSTASFLVDTYLKAGKTSEAVDLVMEQGSRHRENLYVYDKQVEVLQASGDAEQARLILKKMSALAQTDANWLYRIGSRHVAGGSISDAAYVLEKAVQIDPRHFDAQALLAEVHLSHGDLDAVETAARLLVDADPRHDIGPRLLGAVAVGRGDPAGGAEHFRRALALKPDSEENVLSLQLALLEAGQPEDAIEALKAFLASHPDSLQVHVALAEQYMQTGDYQAAKAAFEQSLAKLPEHPMLLNNYANVLFELKDPAALKVAQRAFEKLPDNPVVSDTLGWILVNNGDAEAALRLLRDARTRDSGNPEIQYHLAVALNALGRQQDALTELRGALKSKTRFRQREQAEQLLSDLGG